MRKTTIKYIIAFALCAVCGCQRAWTGCQKDMQASERTYHIEQYSGGKLIGTYDFKGMLNNEAHSDGFYFYQKDTLVEVSGQLIIKSR